MSINKKIYIAIIIFLIIDAVIALFVLYPLFQNIKETSNNFIKRREEIAKLEFRMRKLKELKKDHAKIEPDFKKIKSLFVDSKKPIRFITFTERIADESGVKINIAPGSGSESNNKKWSPVFFKIEASGSFSSFLNFIEKIEYSPWLLSINSLEIKVLEKEKEEKKEGITAFLQLEVYDKKEK